MLSLAARQNLLLPGSQPSSGRPLCMACRTLPGLALPTLLTSCPRTLPLPHPTQPHWPPCHSSDTPIVFPPQDLCSCCSLCLEHFSSSYPQVSHPPLIQVSIQKSQMLREVSPYASKCDSNTPNSIPSDPFYVLFLVYFSQQHSALPDKPCSEWFVVHLPYSLVSHRRWGLCFLGPWNSASHTVGPLFVVESAKFAISVTWK